MAKHISLVEFTIWPFTDDCKDIFINTAEIDGYFIEFNSMGNFERDIESTSLESLFVENEISIQSWVDDYRSSPDPRVQLVDSSIFPIKIHTIWDADYWQDHNGEWDGEIVFKGIVNLTSMLRYNEIVSAFKTAANIVGTKNSTAKSIGWTTLSNENATYGEYLTCVAEMVMALE